MEAGPGVYWVATVGGLARLRSDSAPARQVKAVALNAGNAPLQDPRTLPLTAYLAGLRRGNQPCVRLEKGSRRPDVDRHGRRPVRPRATRSASRSFRRVEPDPSTGPSPFGQVRALAEGPDGALWIGTLSGLFRRLPDGRIIREHTVAAAEEIRTLLVDRLGRIWIGHDRGLSLVVSRGTSAITGDVAVDSRGICRSVVPLHMMSASPWHLAKPVDSRRSRGLPAIVRSLSEGSDGRVWIGTTGGLIEFDGERFRAYSKRHGLTERDHQRRRRGQRGQRLDRHRRRRRRQADEERLRQLQGGGRAQARLRDVDFAESGRSSARRRRVAGRSTSSTASDSHRAGSRIPGRVDGRASTTCSRTTRATCGLAHRTGCFDSRRSPAWRSSLAPGRRPSIRSRTDCLPPAWLRRSRIPVATSG